MDGADFIRRVKTPNLFFQPENSLAGKIGKDPMVWVDGARPPSKRTSHFLKVKL
jgi:hypothetical protein